MAADERTVREQKRACALVALGVAFPVAMSIARAELEREGRLVEALRHALKGSGGEHRGKPDHYMINVYASRFVRLDAAIATYEAEFAPPQRTVEQIARDIASKEGHTFRNGDTFCAIPYSLVTELAAALGKDGK